VLVKHDAELFGVFHGQTIHGNHQLEFEGLRLLGQGGPCILAVSHGNAPAIVRVRVPQVPHLLNQLLAALEKKPDNPVVDKVQRALNDVPEVFPQNALQAADFSPVNH